MLERPHLGGRAENQMKPPRNVALTDNAADTVRGIALACLAYLIWTLADAAAKWAIPFVGVALAMMWRGIFGAGTVALVAVLGPGFGGWRALRPVRWRMVLLRSAMSAFVSMTWYISWIDLQLADTYAIGFTAPLIMTVLAIPMLGERIRWRRMASTLVGFAGVLVMLRPGGDLWTPTVALLMVGIFAMCVTRIMTRQLSVTETPECQSFWLMIAHVGSGALMLSVFPPVGPIDGFVWMVLIFLGLTSGIAHCVNTRAYGLAPVSALAPYEYTALIWGGIAGWVVFGEVLSWTTLIGALIVSAAGLYNLHRERARRTVTPTVPA